MDSGSVPPSETANHEYAVWKLASLCDGVCSNRVKSEKGPMLSRHNVRNKALLVVLSRQRTPTVQFHLAQPAIQFPCSRECFIWARRASEKTTDHFDPVMLLTLQLLRRVKLLVRIRD